MGISDRGKKGFPTRRVLAVLVVALTASVAAAASLPRPTGSSGVDFTLALTLGLFVALAAQHARPHTLAAGALATAGVAAEPLLIAVVGLVTLPGILVPQRSQWRRLARGSSGLGIVAVLLRGEYESRFGVSTVVGMAVVGLLAFRGLRIYRKRHRRRFYAAVGSLALALVAAVAGLFFSVRGSEAHLRNGNREARAGLAALNVGNVPTAREHLERALTSMERASHRLDSWSTQPSRLLPVVAHYRNSIVEVVVSTTAALETINADLGRVDPELLRPVNGRFDLASITDLQAPMRRIVDTLLDLQTTVLTQQSPWFVSSARNYLDELATDIEKYANRGQRTLAALEMAPPLLGANEPRTYFVAFTSPSEVRGSSGFMGNWAEFRVSTGQITMTRFGRTGELNSQGSTPRLVTEPREWVESYGPYGFSTGPGGSVGESPWSNITLSPQFPSTAQVIAELYPQSGGRQVDGVFALDVDVLSALLEFTGPIAVDQRTEPLTASNAREYLLFDQYVELDSTERVDVIDTVAETTIDRLLSGALPSPATLGNRLSPLASEGRILAWAARPREQEFFQSVKLTGDISRVGTNDTVVVALNNGSGNKIDYFLRGAIDYTLDLTERASVRNDTGTLTIELTNTAPADGFPDYVLGNLVDLPRGYSRLIVTTLTRLTPTTVLVNGKPTPHVSRTEAGLNATDLGVDLPPGGTATVTIELEGLLDLASGYSLTTRTPPTATVWSTSVNVQDQQGRVVAGTRQQQGFSTWVVPE